MSAFLTFEFNGASNVVEENVGFFLLKKKKITY